MAQWKCVLTLNSERGVVAGSEIALAHAIRNAADLRVYTEFIHNEHIDTNSDSAERVLEVAEFGVTYLLQDSWAAGIMSLRQPIELPGGFGPRSSMSFFLYNQNGQQAIARPFLDGVPATGSPGPSSPDAFPNMPKYHAQETWDGETNAPSSNFIYDFDVFGYCVSDSWQEILSHDADGVARSGSVDDLVEAFAAGCEVKVCVRGLCASLAAENAGPVDHEVFVQAGSCYFYTKQRLFICGTHPVIRVRPSVPLLYETGGWDFGWLMVRSDGHVVYRRCDPYTLAFQDIQDRYAVRWFVR